MKENKQMIVSHSISSIDNSSGGPSKSSTSLITSMGKASPDDLFFLHTFNTPNPIISSFRIANAKMVFHNREKGYSKNLFSEFDQEKAQLFHGHGLWDLFIHEMSSYARKKRKPYIISPRGMLDTWSINHKKWKKKIALSLYQRKDLANAFVLHATSLKEAENIRKAGFKNPIAVIPNGIELFPVKEKPDSNFKTALFLSRLVKNKGIEELLRAWAEIDKQNSQNWQLRIVGEGSQDYIAYLKKMAGNMNLKSVHFEGGKYGADKDAKFAIADLFILPTYTENFGVAIAEALAAKVPVITTTGAPWHELNSTGAGWQIELSHENLVNAINDAISKGKNLKEMGEKGRKLIEDKYSSEVVARQMIALYNWTLNNGQKPDFVI